MGEATLAELWDDFCRQKDFENSHLVPAKKRSLLHPHPSRDGGYFQGYH